MAKKVDKAQRQAELLEVAIEVFAERGYQATTMDEVAERANVSKGMLYIYFKNKESLFGAVFRWFGAVTKQAMLSAARQTLDPEQKLHQIAKAWAELCSKHRNYVPLFLEFWSVAGSKGLHASHAEDLMEIYKEFRKMFAEVIQSGVQAGTFKSSVDADAISYLMVGGLDGLFLQSWLEPTAPIEPIILNAVQTIVEGMKP